MGKKPANTDVRFWRDPDLPGVEVRYSSYNEEAFRDHTHDEYSIGFIDSGRTTFLMDGEPHQARSGQLVLIPPGAVHACNPDSDSNMAYHMFYVDPALLENMAAEVFGREVGLPVFDRPVVDDSEQVTCWRSLHQAIADGGDRLEKETLLVQAMADLIARHARSDGARRPGDDHEAVARVKGHLATHLADKVSLNDLAGVAHLSRYHLLRIFQDAVGLPPHAYQNQLRVDLGKKLLADGMTISQAAVEAGFVDQSHFSRVFKQVTGATPKQYRDARS